MGFNSRRNTKKLKRIAVGTGVVAAAAGYVAGVMTAPKSGKETRGDIKAAAKKSRAEAEKELKKVQTELEKAMKEAKAQGGKLSTKAQKELKELVEKAKNSKEKTGEVMSAIRAGDAEDQDLKRAIKNAHSSIDHLRDYLKK
jgi:gas vesicle protein